MKRHKSQQDMELASRLSQVALRHSQASIARKLGMGQANVSRYLGGVRVPATFCAGLVEHFGVNPMWLLCGRGDPSLTSTRVETPAVTQLVEVLSAANAARRVALGAIASDHGTSNLRRLAENIEEGARVWEQLQNLVREPIEAASREIAAAVGRLDIQRASALLAHIEPLSRIAGSPASMVEILRWRAMVEYHYGRVDSAVATYRRALGLRAAYGMPTTQEEIEEAGMIAVAMGWGGEAGQGLALCRMADAAGEASGVENRHALHFTQGLLTMWSGDLTKALTQMQTAAAGLRGDELQRANAYLAVAALYSGARDVEEEIIVLRSLPPARGRDHSMDIRCSGVLAFAIWRNERDNLRGALAVYRRHALKPDNSRMEQAQMAESMLHAKEKPRAAVYHEFIKLRRGTGQGGEVKPFSQFLRHLRAATLALNCKLDAVAVEEALRAASARAEISPTASIPPLPVGQYSRLLADVLASKAVRSPGQRETLVREEAWTKDEVTRLVQRGFGFLAR